MSKVLVILGSAREDGDTSRVLDAVLPGFAARRIELRDLQIGHYEYGRSLADDAFLTVAATMIAHDVIVFATPVYWYAMSGLMKVLFDRLTDLVTIRKDLGRQLEGRKVFLVACGSEPELPQGFEVPFRRTAEYLGMNYEGGFYMQTANGESLNAPAQSAAAAFGQQIAAAMA